MVVLFQPLGGHAQGLDGRDAGLEADLAVEHNVLRLAGVGDAQTQPGQTPGQLTQVLRPGIRQHVHPGLHQGVGNPFVGTGHLGDRRQLHAVAVAGRLDHRHVAAQQAQVGLNHRVFTVHSSSFVRLSISSFRAASGYIRLKVPRAAIR